MVDSPFIRALAWLLYNQRNKEHELIFNDARFVDVPKSIVVQSPDFAADEYMPPYTAGVKSGGENSSPPLSIKNVPAEAKSLVWVMQDIDVPLPIKGTHFIAYGINPKTSEYSKGWFSTESEPEQKGLLKWGWGAGNRIGYFGPGPPPGHGDHQYFFEAYAINEEATERLEKEHDISAGKRVNLDQLMNIMHGNVLSMGYLKGLYVKP
ncbi:unnamed protein product [Kuraishia capsulata CBS 1993]|uniref:YbhB/YbcL family Raf kinase inhibitor-like protein n=1 Tax=Kuraishia capsulata CBS 1993 TaxID=1382522 RepID=W6MK13_9ASCO|nr:uncharacterized protein KUCA_T00000874001 [Kuraishia capsulata CBS 1993]CDK24907.1 unnamed protein product [Kuraishia capsulata CBS 1993]